jgi:hypothetical protein
MSSTSVSSMIQKLSELDIAATSTKPPPFRPARASHQLTSASNPRPAGAHVAKMLTKFSVTEADVKPKHKPLNISRVPLSAAPKNQSTPLPQAAVDQQPSTSTAARHESKDSMGIGNYDGGFEEDIESHAAVTTGEAADILALNSCTLQYVLERSAHLSSWLKHSCQVTADKGLETYGL